MIGAVLMYSLCAAGAVDVLVCAYACALLLMFWHDDKKTMAFLRDAERANAARYVIECGVYR